MLAGIGSRSASCGQDALGQDPRPQARVLVHREAVPFRQGQHEVVAVERVHAAPSSLSSDLRRAVPQP